MNSKEMFEVLDRVQAWDTEMRIDLARRIFETVVPTRPSKPVQTMSLDQVVAF